MNPHCSIDLTAFSIARDGKPVDFSPVVGHSCPALIYVATPYMIAMKNGVRFPWEKKADSVLITCPAGHVDFELRAIDENAFRIIILAQDGSCPKHARNDVIDIPFQEDKMRIFNELFPFLFCITEGESVALHGNVSISRASGSGARSARELIACDVQKEIDHSNLLVDVAGMKRSCAYHRKARTFPKEELAPAGLCTLAYHAAYPKFLAMLYGKGLPDSVLLSCPGAGSHIEFALERKARLAKPFLDILEKLLSFTPFRLDIVKYRVKLKVVTNEGDCTVHMKVGDSFSLGNKRFLCPSSFYSLFPALISRLRNRDQATCTCTCTSVPCHVTYKLRPMINMEGQ
jgi:uncharacterized repeat protein (TIGR04076 family)